MLMLENFVTEQQKKKTLNVLSKLMGPYSYGLWAQVWTLMGGLIRVHKFVKEARLETKGISGKPDKHALCGLGMKLNW